MNDLEYLRKATSDYKQTADTLCSMFDEFFATSEKSERKSVVEVSND